MSSGLRLKKTSVTEGEHDSRVVRVLKGGGGSGSHVPLP
jgi:hypothetical protein